MVLPGVSEEEEEERRCLTNTSAAKRHCRKWRASRMAIKRICDRCGAEINPESSATCVNIRKWRQLDQPDIELCCACAMQLNEWIKPLVEEGKKDG